MELKYRILNVFTAGGARLSGNPLCVVEDGSRPRSGGRCRRWRGRSTLRDHVHPAVETRRRAGAHLHARLRNAVRRPSDARHRACVPRARARRQPARPRDARRHHRRDVEGDQWTLRATAATSRLVDAPPPELARLLGLEAADIGFQPLWMKAGREQLIIPLTSEAAVHRVRPKPELFEKLKSVDGAGQAYVFASTGAKKNPEPVFLPRWRRHSRGSRDGLRVREPRRLVHRHGPAPAAGVRSVPGRVHRPPVAAACSRSTPTTKCSSEATSSR